ncbi:hypothetical protein GGR21_003559 [Dysgonomonas hofstadii]|uniref:Uncharacterized protein n=1 Tax=Dysgonomonas hofstadii TaxID=637886 RepID=A0A840CSI9_9BACT|nr:hypothetical protein [Dysgonomonas hofstadii]
MEVLNEYTWEKDGGYLESINGKNTENKYWPM